MDFQEIELLGISDYLFHRFVPKQFSNIYQIYFYIIHILFEKPNLGRDILALKLFEYYYHRHMQENWIDFFKATKSTGRQEIGRGKDVKFKQTRLKAIPL